MSAALRTKGAVAAFAGLSLAGLLAGCSSPSAGATPASGAATSTSSSSSTTTSSGGDFKDGHYSADGTYSSPGGQERINVALTLKDETVTAVTVKTVEADPTATGYEKQFESGVGAVVVGKKLADLAVTKVAGSSLTSQGFDDALKKIEADALG